MPPKDNSEGDTLKLINCLKGSSHPSWNIEPFVEEAQSILAIVEEFKIEHVFKLQRRKQGDRWSSQPWAIVGGSHHLVGEPSIRSLLTTHR